MKNNVSYLSMLVIFITLLSIFIVACEKNDPKPTMVATSISLVSGSGQTGQVSTILANPVVIIVKDQEGNAIAGADVSFTVTEGSVSNTNITSDVNGLASVTWTLGTSTSSQTLKVTAFESDGTTPLTNSPITVTATPLIPSSIELVSGNAQTGNALTALSDPVVIIVKDQEGNAIAGVDVSFTVTEGSVSNANVTSDVNGLASVTWTLGATIGIQKLNVTATGLTGSPIEFNAMGMTSVTDYDGNTYNGVAIGNQIWMTENLKTTHYANGTEIPLVEDGSAWPYLSIDDKAYCYYDNSLTNGNIYGALYTWAAAMNGDESSTANPSGVQGACPTGWHIPSDAEWTELIDYLGGTSIAGGKMKETGTSHWESPNAGAGNSSYFTALPSGHKSGDNALFYALGSYATFRSATESSNTGSWIWQLSYDGTEVSKGYPGKRGGVSVRCLKDN